MTLIKAEQYILNCTQVKWQLQYQHHPSVSLGLLEQQHVDFLSDRTEDEQVGTSINSELNCASQASGCYRGCLSLYQNTEKMTFKINLLPKYLSGVFFR